MTAIEIINAAITRLGCDPIENYPGTDTNEERVATAQYVAALEYVLADREWTFAKRRIRLTRSATVPEFGYTYQYVIPANVLRVVRSYDSADGVEQIEDWIREGWFVLTDAATVYSEVLVRVDEAQLSPGAVQALIEYLMHVMAVPLTENAKESDDALERYEKKMRPAGAIDGSQGRTQRLQPKRLPGRSQ